MRARIPPKRWRPFSYPVERKSIPWKVLGGPGTGRSAEAEQGHREVPRLACAQVHTIHATRFQANACHSRTPSMLLADSAGRQHFAPKLPMPAPSPWSRRAAWEGVEGDWIR